MDNNSGNNEQDKNEKKLMLKIFVDGHGNIFVNSAVHKKEFVVNLLADSLKIVSMVEDLTPKQKFAGNRLRKFLNRGK